MEISPNSTIISPTREAARPVAGSVPQLDSDSTAFSATDRLNVALRETPETRLDAVSRAKDLMRDEAYPPLETIRQIGALLATHLDQTGTEPPTTHS